MKVSAQILSAQNGNWFTATTWVGGVIPTENDDVVIRHTITQSTANTIAQARSILISNTLNNNAFLDLSDGQMIIGAGGLTMTGTTANNVVVRFRIYNVSNVTINGNVNITNELAGDNRVRFSVVDNGRLTVNGNFVYSYQPNDANDEGNSEISFLNNSISNLNGDFRLVYNTANKRGKLNLLIDNNARVEIDENLIFDLDNAPNNANRGIDLLMGDGDVLNQSTALLKVNGSVNLNNKELENPRRESIELAIQDQSRFEIGSNLNFNYLPITNIYAATEVEITQNGYLLVNQNVEFTNNGSSQDNNRIYLNGNGTIELKGNIINANAGRISTNNTDPASLSTFILSGNQQQIVPQIENQYKSLTINNSSGIPLTLAAYTEVIRNLSMQNGILDTGGFQNFLLRFDATANEGSPNSYIINGLRKNGPTNFFFPVGDGLVWAPVHLQTNVGNGNTYFEIDYSHEDHPIKTFGSGINNVSQVEFWTLRLIPNPENNTTGTPTSAVATFYWKNACRSYITNTATNPTQDLLIARLSTNGNSWMPLITTINPNSFPCNVNTSQGSLSITLGNEGTIAQYGDFTFASVNGNGNPLPVTWLDFYIVENQNDVELHWSTATEINSDYFEIQKSIDGMNWNRIDQVKAAGNSNQENFYAYVDSSSIVNCYYRLKQLDVDGHYEYSSVIQFVRDKDEFTSTIYPNPWHKNNQSLHIENRETGKLGFYNLTGDLVLSIESNKNSFNADDINLPQGVYILKLLDQQNKIVVNTRLIIFE